MKCKQNKSNPAACLDKGSEVLTCVTETLQQINKKCGPEFKVFTECLRENAGEFEACREQQSVFRAAWASVE